MGHGNRAHGIQSVVRHYQFVPYANPLVRVASTYMKFSNPEVDQYLDEASKTDVDKVRKIQTDQERRFDIARLRAGGVSRQSGNSCRPQEQSCHSAGRPRIVLLFPIRQFVVYELARGAVNGAD